MYVVLDTVCFYKLPENLKLPSSCNEMAWGFLLDHLSAHNQKILGLQLVIVSSNF